MNADAGSLSSSPAFDTHNSPQESAADAESERSSSQWMKVEKLKAKKARKMQKMRGDVSNVRTLLILASRLIDSNCSL